MLSTSEAASRLGVSTRRVQELIKSGALEAEKVSGVWLVDESSVSTRSKTANKRGGRPVRGSSRNEAAFMLMNREHEIAPLIYSKTRREFTHLGATLDPSRAPIGLAVSKGAISASDFNAWWRNRGIPQTRQGLAGLLFEAGVSLPDELIQRNLGLSLSDQYWIRPEGSGLAWKDINFFSNDFEDVSLATADYAVEGKDADAKPDNTSDGNLEKYWTCIDGVRTLVKSGTTYGQEPYNEVVASALHARLLKAGEYVPYRLVGNGATAHCSCPNFLSDQEEYVPAVYVERTLEQGSGTTDFEHYLACCESLGIADTQRALDRMIVCDDILANHDRHHRNFGIVRNIETLECRPAPIFDSGSSLWCDIATDALVAGERSFASKQFYESPAKQMLLVKDLGWLDVNALEGFVDEACDILEGNDAIAARLPCIRRALEWRVRRMIGITEWD